MNNKNTNDNCDYNYALANLSRSVASFVKFLLVAVGILYVFLYFTRPELEITGNTFISTMKSKGLKVYELLKVENAPGLKAAYKAVGENLVIYYYEFDDKNDSHNFYEKYTYTDDTKHMYKLSRDYRLDGVASEKISYVYDDNLYYVIYTKNAVIFTFADTSRKVDLDPVFKELYQVPKIDFENLQSYYSEYFKSKH